MNKWRVLVVALLAVLLLVGAGYFFREQLIAQFFKPTNSQVSESKTDEVTVDVVATGLDTPWSIAELPNGDLLVTERGGRVKRVGEKGQTYLVNGVRETSEGGLLGIALHPNFDANRLLYLYFTTGSGGNLTNQVDQYRYDSTTLTYIKTIIAAIPAASNHDGGGVKFGPDRKLYVTTGDAAQESLAQDTNSLAGKILRMNDDGSRPNDNPYDNFVWSYGHRNPQGIAWDKDDRLWSVEHGPSGNDTGKDELNRIEKGANYGWPVVTGDQARTDMKSPIAHSGTNETWAPAGLTYLQSTLYFAGLRGQSLYAATINNDGGVALTRMFTGTYGRLRAVTAAKDGSLLVSTSNRDGRGSPASDDDKILKITVNE